MWKLNDETTYLRIAAFEVPRAVTWVDMRAGHTDREKREVIRKVAIQHLPHPIPHAQWWAFRIFVRKRGVRRFDIENVLKLIVDSFCAKQIEQDHSNLKVAGLFQDDTVDHVRMLQVAGERTLEADSTTIEIFARIKP